jgi:group I intron endonuclease
MRAVGYVYVAKCKASGKAYVGQTIASVGRRFNAHLRSARNGSELPFHRALRKYGKDGFEVSTVQECADLEELNKAESFWIEKLGFFGEGGYNCTTGGEGYKVLEETKRKVSVARKGKHLSAAHRDRISTANKGERNPFYGRKHKQESIDMARPKISAKLSGERNPFYGKTHTEEALQKMSEANLGRPMSEANREAMRVRMLGNSYTKGRHLSEEQKRIVSATFKGKKFTQEHKDRIAAALRGKKHTAERRANISAAQRARFDAKKEHAKCVP